MKRRLSPFYVEHMDRQMVLKTDYDEVADNYSRQRKPDPRIKRVIRRVLGDAGTIVNVGAGTGSYEPDDMQVTPVEPSHELGRRHNSPEKVVSASAESLPFADGSFDAALAILTVHHWNDIEMGLVELRRVARERVVVVTWDPKSPPFWLTRDYFPSLRELDEVIFPSLDVFAGQLGGDRVEKLMIPHDCVDGFLGAYWRRPEMYLYSEAREAISSFAKVGDIAEGLAALSGDLESGHWLKRNGGVLALEEYDVGYRIVICEKRRLGSVL